MLTLPHVAPKPPKTKIKSFESLRTDRHRQTHQNPVAAACSCISYACGSCTLRTRLRCLSSRRAGRSSKHARVTQRLALKLALKASLWGNWGGTWFCAVAWTCSCIRLVVSCRCTWFKFFQQGFSLFLPWQPWFTEPMINFNYTFGVCPWAPAKAQAVTPNVLQANVRTTAVAGQHMMVGR